MNTKPLYMQSEDEILDNASKILEKIKMCPVTYDRTQIQSELHGLIKVAGEYFSGGCVATMITALYNAESYFGLPVWWDGDRVSVNGCHVDFKQFNGDRQKARIWSSIKAISVYANI